ncbi:hypothetical protein B566_EDAN010156 [Ephemera danica]|nr:hypothetical protein B566_EDAN010156 [Ephemera danica]
MHLNLQSIDMTYVYCEKFMLYLNFNRVSLMLSFAHNAYGVYFVKNLGLA